MRVVEIIFAVLLDYFMVDSCPPLAEKAAHFSVSDISDLPDRAGICTWGKLSNWLDSVRMGSRRCRRSKLPLPVWLYLRSQLIAVLQQGKLIICKALALQKS